MAVQAVVLGYIIVIKSHLYQLLRSTQLSDRRFILNERAYECDANAVHVKTFCMRSLFEPTSPLVSVTVPTDEKLIRNIGKVPRFWLDVKVLYQFDLEHTL
uniref:Putative secreted peptide n=1 Tax=Anopheles braziliensis TaxID=58242 RepID=A0A2M3ZQ57_9DIPT